jgi:hypothetical protein
VAAPHTRIRDARPRVGEVALLCAARGLASLAAYSSGFRALSDDDYARISIAQRFAESVSFDPSRTSWLPAPFWLYGAAFRVFGRDLAVARVTAIALSVGATLLVYVATRLLGAGRPGAFMGAALSAFLPYSALLGVAAVPEVPCAALILLGAATLALEDPRARTLGGLSLTMACLSRYEAWPVAVVFAGFSLSDARRNRALVVGAAAALLGPTLWLLVGWLEHGHALFFVARVANYRRALGPTADGPIALRLLEYPGLLLRAEPELCALFVVIAAAAWRFVDRQKLAAYRRTGLALSALLAFLMFGSVRDGVPTHHAARVLLPIWFFVCVLCGHGLAHLVARTSGRARVSWLAFGVAAALAGLLLRSRFLPKEGFAERQLELAAGSEAKRRGATALAIDTPDYGYLAVQAAFGSPKHSSTLDDHDPRHARPPDPFTSRASLSRALREHGARYLVATRAHASIAGAGCTEVWQNARFGLFDCTACAAPPLIAP